MKRISLIIIFLLTLNVATVVAQQSVVGFNYSMAFPSYDLNDHIGETSFRGISVYNRLFITDDFSVGTHIGWQVFKKRLEGTFSTDDGNDISGTQVRYVNTFPLIFQAHHYLGESGSVRPYIGVGAGPMLALRRTDIGIFAIQDNTLHFAVASEIGIHIPMVAWSGINVSARFDHAFGTDNSGMAYSYFTINLGVFGFE
ncbi:MAG: hypothetical protein JXR03_18230 [Cyclobacteriaceae bacterium]